MTTCERIEQACQRGWRIDLRPASHGDGVELVASKDGKQYGKNFPRGVVAAGGLALALNFVIDDNCAEAAG